jgi:hypothetical protein
MKLSHGLTHGMGHSAAILPHAPAAALLASLDTITADKRVTRWGVPRITVRDGDEGEQYPA